MSSISKMSKHHFTLMTQNHHNYNFSHKLLTLKFFVIKKQKTRIKLIFRMEFCLVQLPRQLLILLLLLLSVLAELAIQHNNRYIHGTVLCIKSSVNVGNAFSKYFECAVDNHAQCTVCFRCCLYVLECV